MGTHCDPWAATAPPGPVSQMSTQASSLFSFFTAPSWRMPSPKWSEKIPARPTVNTWPGRTAPYHRRRPRTLATGWVRGKLSLGSGNSWATTHWSVGCLASLSWWSRQSCQGDITARYCTPLSTHCIYKAQYKGEYRRAKINRTVEHFVHFAQVYQVFITCPFYSGQKDQLTTTELCLQSDENIHSGSFLPSPEPRTCQPLDDWCTMEPAVPFTQEKTY